MKYSKTTLMELSHKYASILRKCALFNATILVGAMIAIPTMAKSITEDLTISGEENEQNYNENLTINANLNLTNTGIYSDQTISVAGGSFTMTNSELGGHNNLDITGGTFNLSSDSELAGEPKINISNATITLNASHLLSRTDGATKGEINITNSNITVNKGFIGAFNYSDGGETEDTISEGG